MELYPSAQPPPKNKNPPNTNKRPPEKRNWTFPVVCYFTSKLEFFSNILSVLVVKIFLRHFRNIQSFRSSRSHMFFRIGILKNLAIFTGRHLCWSLLLLIKLQAWSSSIFKSSSFCKHFPWLLLKFLAILLVLAWLNYWSLA